MRAMSTESESQRLDRCRAGRSLLCDAAAARAADVRTAFATRRLRAPRAARRGSANRKASSPLCLASGLLALRRHCRTEPGWQALCRPRPRRGGCCGTIGGALGCTSGPVPAQRRAGNSMRRGGAPPGASAIRRTGSRVTSRAGSRTGVGLGRFDLAPWRATMRLSSASASIWSTTTRRICAALSAVSCGSSRMPRRSSWRVLSSSRCISRAICFMLCTISAKRSVALWNMISASPDRLLDRRCAAPPWCGLRSSSECGAHAVVLLGDRARPVVMPSAMVRAISRARPSAAGIALSSSVAKRFSR